MITYLEVDYEKLKKIFEAAGIPFEKDPDLSNGVMLTSGVTPNVGGYTHFMAYFLFNDKDEFVGCELGE